MKNKTLSIIAVLMIPFVVISFSFKSDETNFILENKEEKVESIEVNVLVNGEVKNLDLEDYIIGVVAGEMPASFEEEALKAQAVASRSYALYKKNNSQNAYDLTDDTSTQVYITEDDMKKKWGEEYTKYYDKISSAVKSTRGEVATYNGEIIEAFYFAMSSGTTQDSQMVFGESFDYLKSVESIYDNDSLNNYEVEKTFSIDEFKSAIGLDCNPISIDYIDRNESGYVDEISLCSKNFRGIDMRSMLGLRSANFDIEIGENVTITTYGYGHGVGMSQYGANGYAKNGYNYKEILKHYYNNIEITNIYDV